MEPQTLSIYFPEDTDYSCVESNQSNDDIRSMIIHDELNSFPNIITVRINIINDEQYYNDGTSNRVKLHYVRTLGVEDV